MTIETFAGVQIAYLRRTGRYGAGSKQLMEELKARRRTGRDTMWAWSSPARQRPCAGPRHR